MEIFLILVGIIMILASLNNFRLTMKMVQMQRTLSRLVELLNK